MKQAKLFFIVVLTFLAYGKLYSQVGEDLLQIIENSGASEEQAEELLQITEQKNNNPFKIYNVNTLSREEMILLGLNNFQILALENYILRTGELFSVNELRFINGFDSVTVSHLLPFLTAAPRTEKHSLKPDSVFKNSVSTLRLQYVQNLKTPYGFTRQDGKGFVGGGNFASVLRYKLKYYDCLEFSLVADKDFGEPLFIKGKTYGYDHYNIALTLNGTGKYLKQITIGDYRLNTGEGLAMKQNFSFGYFSPTFGAKQSAKEIVPMRSSTEYNYNKGIAAKFNAGKVDILAFASYTPIDYNGKTVQQTGYHRTQAEIDHKYATAVAMGGSSMQYWNKGFNLGITFFAYHYKDSVYIGQSEYQKYLFEGKDNNVVAVNTSYERKNMIVFGEIARSMNNAYSFLLGQQYSLGYRSGFSIVLRKYSPDYQNAYANAIGVQSCNRNETGVYADYSYYVSRKLQFSAGFDMFYFPKESYRAKEKALGEKFRAVLSYQIHEKHLLDFNLRLQNRQYNGNTKDAVTELCNNIIIQPQLKYKFSYSERLAFVYRIGYSHTFIGDADSDYGFYNYVEMILRAKKLPLDFNLRWTYFRTTSYDNRFCVYEYSLPMSYSSAMLYNTGNKLYVMLGGSLSKNWKIYLRYNLTRYNNTKEISSGNTKITGNLQHYAGGQIFYKF